MYDGYGLFIDGEWRPAADGALLAVVDPATEDDLGTVPQAGIEDANAAIDAAQRCFLTWSRTPGAERSVLLLRVAALVRERRDEIARQMTLETGKPLAQSKGEVEGAAAQFDWFAAEARRVKGEIVEPREDGSLTYITREPVGVVAAFTPWNFPVGLVARKLAPALAAGCTVVVRSAEEAPGCVMQLIRCFADAGAPNGLVNLLTGVPQPVSDVLMASPIVRKVSFTGSVSVGKTIIEKSAQTVKRVSLELGGHAPVIIFDDVDVAAVASQAVISKFNNAGQICVSPTRFYVHEQQAVEFTDRFVDATRKLKVGNGLDPQTDVGPLSTERRLKEIQSLVDETKTAGATLHVGGQRPADQNKGYYFEPTVFSDVDDSMRIMRQEVFGPVAPITTFSSYDDVMERANSSELGLAGYVFAGDGATGQRAVRDLECGMVALNTFKLGRVEAPFGGIKQSGYGREGGSGAIYDYMNEKWSQVSV